MADNSPDNSNEPQGLDEFLTQPEPMGMSAGQGEPEGLNEFIAPEMKEAQFGTPGQVALTAAESFGKGLVGPIAPATERMLGVNPEDILAREEVNPGAHYAAEIAGLAAPALLTLGASVPEQAGLQGLARFTQAGALEAVGKGLGLEAGDTLASRIGVGAAKAAIDNMLIQGSDETSRMILNDPTQTAQTALSDIGLAGAIGGILGGGIGGATQLWKNAVGSKAGQVIEDFRARVNEHMTNPDPVNAMTNELSEYYKGITGIADEVYGPQGLKAQDVEKLMPETLSPKIDEQIQGLAKKLQGSVDTMVSDPYTYPTRFTQMLQNDFDNMADRISAPDAGPKEVFNAMQDLKQTLQGYAKFEKRVAPFAEEAGFVKISKQLQFDLREALEDKAVWGDAATRQQAINSAFKDYLPALKDFEKRFTTEVAGERQIDPGKINTYLNQVGKPNAEIKQANLRNFLDASDKYKKVIDQTHTNLGMDSPVVNSALNITRSSLNEKTLGSKLADAFISKGLADTAGKGLGATIGGTLAHVAGMHGEMGALIGAHALGPFFNSVLPAITKGVIGAAGSAEGFKAATEYGLAAAKGDALLSKGARNILKAGAEVLPQMALPKANEKEKLNRLLSEVQANPDKMLGGKDQLQHYLPNHSLAMNETVGSAIQYLNSLRASTDKQSPLDSKPVMSPDQKASFDRALTIAQQPLIVLDKIKQGTLTAQDITHLGNLYPGLYNRIKDKLLDAVNNHVSKDEVIPYRTRIGLSMFLAQPMDSTMSPASIMAAQLTLPAPVQPQQGAPKGVKSSPALQKMPNLYMTPGQSRLEHRTR